MNSKIEIKSFEEFIQKKASEGKEIKILEKEGNNKNTKTISNLADECCMPSNIRTLRTIKLNK